MFCPELHGRRARPTPERTHKRCRFRVTGSCTDSGQIHVVARAVFLPLESNLTLLGVGYFQSKKTLPAVCALTPTPDASTSEAAMAACAASRPPGTPMQIAQVQNLARE